MRKHLWKKRVALMICVLMAFTSMPSASFALTARDSTAADQTTEAKPENDQIKDQAPAADQKDIKEPSIAAEETTEKASGAKNEKNAGSSEATKAANAEPEKESSEIKTPKRKAVKFSADYALRSLPAGETTTLKKTYKNPYDGISKAVIELESKKDGYKESDTDFGVNFGVKLTLDGDYLYAGFDAHEGDPGFPKFDGTDYDAYMAKVDKFLQDLPTGSLAPIVYTYDLGEDFTVAENDKGERIKEEALIFDGEKLGILKAEKQKDDHCVVTITFDNKVYNRSEVSAGMTIDLEIDQSKLQGETPVVAGWKDDKIVVDVQGSFDPNDPPAPAKMDYTVDKTAKEKVDTPYIDYTIVADTAAAGKKLEGLILEDTIPDGMEIVSVEKDGQTDPLTKADSYSETTYKVDGNKLTYQFQPKALLATETKATFKIRLALKAEGYKADAKDGSVEKAGIENKAKLLDADKTTPMSEEGVAETDMKFSVMKKDGKPEGLNGMRYAWTLDVNTQFSEMTNSYIADVICFDDHRFDGDAGLGVYIDGKYKKNVKFTQKEVASSKTYEALKNGMYESVVGGETDPFYYVYAKDGKNYAVLIIPFGKDYQNHKVQFKYYTNVWLGEKDGKPVTVDGWLKDHKGSLPTKDITNDAKFIWDRFIYGDGVYWDDFIWDVNLEKDTKTTVSLGSKSAGAYDQQTQMLKWKFIVNNFGAGMKNTTITDTLDKDKYNLDNLKLSYVKYDRTGGTKDDPKEIETSGTVHYALDKATGELVITMPPDISANDYYEITMEIQVTDPEVLAQQGTKTGFDNTAKFSAQVGGADVTNEYTAAKDLTNTLITKETVGSYDYDTKKLAWRVGVDPNHIALTDLVLTDDLPLGNSFENLARVTRVGKDGTKHETQANISANKQTVTLDNGVVITLTTKEGTEGKYKKDQAVFTFSGKGTNTDYLEDSYIFDFTTQITDGQYLTDQFMGNDDVKVTNEVKLDGKYKGTEINGSANAEAVHAIESGKITKNGKYVGEEGKISWSVTFNQDKVYIGGMELIEEIGGQPLEIDDSTLALYTIDSDGNEKEYSKLGESDFKSLDNKGFTYVIPNNDTINNKTLVLKFDTYLTGSAETGDIRNTVHLEKDGKLQETSEESNGGYDGTFDIDDYVKAAKNPILQIMKTSANDDGDTPQVLPLAGAKFVATAFGKTEDGEYNTSAAKYNKAGTTNSDGKLNFVNLKKEYVYELYEDEAPAGYNAEDLKTYYLFTDEAALTGSTATLKVNNKDVEVNILKADLTSGQYPEEAIKHTLTNAPKGNLKIQFKKTDSTNGTFNGNNKTARFQLKDKNGYIKNKEATTATYGMVTFEQVDPGEYTLTELTSDDPYDQGAIFDVEIKADGTYTITKESGNATITGSQGNYEIKNQYAKGEIKLKKVGSDTGAINLNGAEFGLYNAEGSPVGTAKTTGTNGVVTFSDVPYSEGGYTVKETKPPNGYSNVLPAGKGEIPVTVETITAADMTAALTAAKNQDGTAKKFTIDFTDTADEHIKNDRTKGSIILTKKDSNEKALQGRKFQLFYNNSDGYNGWKKGDSVGAAQQTGPEGKLTFTDIPYGDYTLKETSPEGDIYQAYSKDFTLRDEMQISLDENRTDTESTNDNTFAVDLGTIVNKLLTANFSIEKQDATTKEEMEGVSFKLTGKDADGKTVSKTGKTNGDGTIDWSGIPIGADNGATPYILTETKPDGYKTPTKYNVYVKSEEGKAVVTVFTRQEDGNNGTQVTKSAGNYTLTNQPVTGKITFTKQNENGEGLSGAEFRLYRKINGTAATNKGEWSEDNPLGYHTATSGADGVVKFDPVEFGDYELQESVPPAGYKLWTDKQPVHRGDLGLDGETFTYNGGAIQNVKTDLKFEKKDQFGNAVEGAKLKLTGDFADKTKEKTWISGESPEDLAANLIVGEGYTLSETKAPDSGLYKPAGNVTFRVAKDGTLIDFTGDSKDYGYVKSTGTLTLTDAYYLAHVKLIKKDSTDPNKTLAGIKFNLYQQTGVAPSDADDILIAKDLVTGVDGTWSSASATGIDNKITKAKLSEGLSNGNYYFKETAATDGYALDTTAQPFAIAKDNDGGTVELTITNAPVNASVALTKLDGTDGSKISDTTFTLTRTKDGSGSTVIEAGVDQTTGVDGTMKFKNLQKGTYTLEETSANTNYQPEETDKFACEFTVTDDCKDQTLQINSEEVGTATEFDLNKTQGTWTKNGVINKRKTGSVTLAKKGNINGTEKPLKDAEFTLYYNDGNKKDQPVQKAGKDIAGTTDNNGTFTIDDLEWAKYYLMETKVPAGYIIDKTHLDFEIKAGSLSKGFQQIGGEGQDIINDATSFTIAKKNDTLTTGLKGAKFAIKGIFAGETGETTRNYDLSGVDSLADYQQLVTGETYTVTETEAPAGYELDSTPKTMKVEEDGKITVDGKSAADNTLTFKDKPIEIKLHKIGETELLTLTGGTYEVTPALGSKFAGEPAPKKIAVTEANMQTQLSGHLIAGNEYVLTEITAPEGYEVAKPVTFTVNNKGLAEIIAGNDIAAINDTDPDTPTLQLKDDKIRIKLKKVNAQGTMLDGAVFTVTPDPGSHSKFAMTGNETEPPAAIDVSITLKDGALAPQKELDGRLITGDRYILSEKAQPSGYIKLEGDIMVEVKEGEKLEIVPPAGAKENAAEIQDEGKTVRITDQANKLTIKKQDDGGKALSADDLELQIKDSQGKVISTLNKGNQDKTGEWTLNAKLTAGKTYTVTESKTPYGYLKASDITFTMQDDGTAKVVSGADQTANSENSNNLYLTDGQTFVVRDVLIQGTVSLHKTDSDKTALSGVEFDLYQMKGETPAPTTDTKINKTSLTTDKDGNVTVDKLGEGQYYFVETAAHDDKVFDPAPTKVLAIDKDQHKKIVSMDVVNEGFLTSVHLTKRDGEDGGAIANTQFTLYKVEEGKDIKVTAATTDKDGDLTLKLTSKGDYKIVETQASKGYQLTDKPFTAKFSVENTKAFQGKTLELTQEPTDAIKNQYKLSYENASFYEKTAAANQRILGKLTLKKTDKADNKALDGAEFTLYKEKSDSGFENIWDFITGKKYEPAEKMTWSEQAGETGKITVSGLAWGKYYIQETKAADGYQLPKGKDARYDFTIGRDANDITLTADAGTITNLQTKIEFTKMGKYIETCSDTSLGAFSPDSLRPVSGAEFAISKEETPDKIIKTASSDAAGKVEFYKLSPGTYCIKETKAPKGYLKDDTTYTVNISTTGEASGLTPMKGAGSLISGDHGDQVINDVARGTIEIKKVSEQKQDQPIAGSVYGLYRKTPQSSSQQPSAAKNKSASYAVAKKSSDTDALQLIAKATTGEDGYLRFEGVLMGVDYVIRELVSPPGSQVSEKPITIVFNVDPNTGKAVITHYEDGNGTAWIDPETGQIIWKEPSIMLSFDKRDEKGNLLKGAQLELQTKDGEVIDSWISSDKQAHMIYGDRMDGKITNDGTYRLVETAAPEGYLTAKSVQFTVETKPTGPQESFVQTITMVDKKKPANGTKPASGTAGGGSAEATKTGDDFPVQLLILLLLLSGGAAVVALRRKN